MMSTNLLLPNECYGTFGQNSSKRRELFWRQITDERSSLRIFFPQILAVCIKNFLFLELGMSMGFPTILIPKLSGKDPNEKIRMNIEQISWIASIIPICIPLGSLISSSINSGIGRKKCLQLMTIPYLMVWLLFYFSNSAWQIFFALAVIGSSGGIVIATAITYVAEVTQPQLRGILYSTSTICFIIGALCQYLLCSFLPWRQAAFINCFFPVVCLVLVSLIPESPIWLLSRSRTEEAEKSLAWLRGWSEVKNIQEEFEEMHLKVSETTSSNDENKTKSLCESIEFLAKKRIYWPLSLVLFSFFLKNFDGTACISNYAVPIFITIKAPINEYHITVIKTAIELVGCTMNTIFIHVLGKRVITFVSLAGTGLCIFVVAIYIGTKEIFYLHSTNPLNETTYWIPSTGVVLANFFSYFGVTSLPGVLTGEFFPHEYRAQATGLSTALGFIFSFATNKIFLYEVSLITLPGTFLFYALICLLGLVIMYLYLPETEGKTLSEIDDHFNGISTLGNEVRRSKCQKDVNIQKC